nr:DNA modification methylase [Microbacterium immunditiarum]
MAAAVALGTSGCAMVSTQATTIPYSPADGVNVPDSGPLKVRNVLIVADEEGVDGNFVAAIVNDTDEAQTLRVEFGEPAERLTVRVPANSVVSLGEDEEPILLEGIDTMPGADIDMFFQSGDHTGVVQPVPVLDGTLPYLADLVP